MIIFDEQMKKVAEQRKKRGQSIRRVGQKGSGFIDHAANKEMVSKVNNLRRRSSISGNPAPVLQVFAKEIEKKGDDVKEKRRKSSVAMTQKEMEVLSGSAHGGISPEAMKALSEAAEVAKAEKEYQEQHAKVREEKAAAQAKVEEAV